MFLRSRFWFKLSGGTRTLPFLAQLQIMQTPTPWGQKDKLSVVLRAWHLYAHKEPDVVLPERYEPRRCMVLHGHSWSFRGPPPTIVEPPPLSASTYGFML